MDFSNSVLAFCILRSLPEIKELNYVVLVLSVELVSCIRLNIPRLPKTDEIILGVTQVGSAARHSS